MNEAVQFFSTLSTKDFAAFGVNHIAYLKPVVVDGNQAVAIHAADGTPLTVVPDNLIAGATVRQNDMEPLSVH